MLIMDNTHSNTSSLDNKTVLAGVSPKTATKPLNIIGKCLKNRYLIESQIGSGGMSDIYRAKDLHLESAGISEPYVAIKVLLHQFSSIPEAKEILVKEARKTQQLSHPNIIRVYDVDSYEDFHFIVMEWLDGETLDQVIKRSKPVGVPFKGATILIQQIGEALAYAHKIGIVHTDLKPSNIILTRQGIIKIFDFGVARALQLNFDKYAVQHNEHSSPLSGFTPAYASYEQLEGDSPCATDDIFSFSCIIYELLSSKHPYQRTAANKIDLKTTPLKKPGHLNWLLWPTLKQGLALKKAQRCKNVEIITKGFANKLWPKVLGVAASVVVATAAFQVYQAQHIEIKNLNNVIALSDSEQNKINAFKNLSTLDFLSQLDSIPAEQRLLKQGLLREHRPSILKIVEKRILSVPKGVNGIYKDYDQIDLIIDDALTLYPDSIRLIELKNESNNSRIATVDALTERLNLLLTQGRYSEQADNSIDRIINDLAFIDPTYRFQPDENVFNIYRDNFSLALKNHDVGEITTLISVGELAFPNHKSAKPLLEFGKAMKLSVTQLARYNEKINAGQTVQYPYKAAEVFYKTTFEQFNNELNQLSEAKELMKIDRKISELDHLLPNDFIPLVAVKKQMAAFYLNYGNESLAKNHLKTARKLIKRGNELYTLIN